MRLTASAITYRAHSRIDDDTRLLTSPNRPSPTDARGPSPMRVRCVGKCCPFAHPGEHAWRRPLDKYCYSAHMCSFARRGVACPQGDNCQYAHHLFEVRMDEMRAHARMCDAFFRGCETAGGSMRLTLACSGVGVC